MGRFEGERLRRIAAAGLTLALAVGAPSAEAGVQWVPGGTQSLDAVVREAGQEGNVVLLVISEPLWCLPCAELHQRWLDPAGDDIVAQLTRNARVLLVNPTTEAGAEALTRHRVRYQGLPSVIAFRPDAETRLLGEAEPTGGLVGAPPDFPSRLAGILSEADPADALRTALEDESSRAERTRLRLRLGDLLAARGDAEGARAAYDAADRDCPDRTTADDGTEDAALCRLAEWKAVGVRLQMLDDPEMGLNFLSRFDRRHGDDPLYAEAVIFGTALGLVRLERHAEALDLLESHFADRPPSASELEALVWTSLQSGDTDFLRFAERKAREAIGHLPENGARCLALVGRLMAAQGDRQRAGFVLTQAVEQATDSVERETYRRQRESLSQPGG